MSQDQYSVEQALHAIAAEQDEFVKRLPGAPEAIAEEAMRRAWPPHVATSATRLRPWFHFAGHLRWFKYVVAAGGAIAVLPALALFFWPGKAYSDPRAVAAISSLSDQGSGFLTGTTPISELKRLRFYSASINGLEYPLPALQNLQIAGDEIAEAINKDPEIRRHYDAAMRVWAVVLRKSADLLAKEGLLREATSVFYYLDRIARDDREMMMNAYALAEMHKLMGEHGQSIAVLDRLLSRLPKKGDPRVYCYRGWARYEIGDWAGAAEDFESAIAAFDLLKAEAAARGAQPLSGYAKAHLNLALAYERISTFSEAERKARVAEQLRLATEITKEALTREPLNARALFTWAIECARAGDLEQARRSLETTLQVERSYVTRAEYEPAFRVLGPELAKLLDRYRPRSGRTEFGFGYAEDADPGTFFE